MSRENPRTVDVAKRPARRGKRDFTGLPLEDKERFVEMIKERIYASITLIAILAGQLPHAAAIRPSSLLFSIFGTVFALWGATIIAHRMSYRVVHGADRSQQSYRNLLWTSFGLLIPAIIPSVVALGGIFGLYSVKSAIITSIALLLLTLFGFALMASRQVYTSWTRIVLLSFTEMALGFVIVAVKILAE